MPTSNLAVWPAILHLAWEVKPARVLDVGPGFGKGGLLLREYVGCPPIFQIDAVESWEPYVNGRLHAIYDEVIQGDVLEMTDDELARYDLVMMIEVIEHLEKEDGLELLDRIPGYVIVCTPRDFFQNPEAEMIPPEKHRSHWSVVDFGGRADRHDIGSQQIGAVLVRLNRKEEDL